MAGIHGSNLAFFQKQEYATAIDSIKDVPHDPRGGDMPGPDQVVEFVIPKSPRDFIDFEHSELRVKMKLVKPDGTPFVMKTKEVTTKENGEDVTHEVELTNDKRNEFVAPIDLLFHTMWKSVDVDVQHNTISSCGNHYAHKAMIDTIINTTRSEKENILESQGFFGDKQNFECSHPFGGPAVTGKDIPESNPGLTSRWEWTNDGHEIEMRGPLLTDIWSQDHLLLNNVDMTIRLTPNSDDFRLMSSPPGLKVKWQFTQLQLILRRVTLNEKVVDGINAGLSIMPAQYPHRKSDIRVYQIPKGSFQKNLDDIWQNQVPTKVIIGLVESQAYYGKRDKNPLWFRHCNLTSAGIYKDYEYVTQPSFVTDFDKGHFLDALLALWRISSNDGRSKDIGVDKQLFSDGMALICFDLDPSVPYNMRYWGPVKKGNMRLQLTFGGVGTPEEMNLIVYALFPATVKVDADRKVITQSTAVV